MSSYTSPVFIGFPDSQIKEKDHTHLSWKCNKIGGVARFPPGVNNSTLDNIRQRLKCKICSNQLSFLCQLYCPVDESSNDRILYIFVCLQNKCKVFEIIRCLIKAYQKCTIETKLFYSSWSDSEEELNDNFHENINNSLDYEEGIFLQTGILLKSYYISVEEEEFVKQSNKNKEEQDFKNIEICNNNESIGETYERTEIDQIYGRDIITYKFYKNLMEIPQQIIRYSWKGKPFVNRSELELHVEKCHCGNERVYECQLMPALISFLLIEDADLDFGTILIYTCEQNCNSGIVNFEKYIFLEEVDTEQLSKLKF